MPIWAQVSPPAEVVEIRSHVGQAVICLMVVVVLAVWLGRPRRR